MSEMEINRNIKDLFNSAEEKFYSKQYDNAINILRSAEVLDRENPEILFLLGLCYCRLGLHKTANEYLYKILGLPHGFIDNLTVKRILSYSLISSKKYEEALKYLDEILILSGTDAATLNMKGFVLEKMEKYDEAIQSFKLVLENDRDNLTACNSLAYVMALKNENLDEALKFAKIANDSRGDNPAYLDTLGFIYLKKGQDEKACEYFNKALSIAPFSAEIKEHIDMCKK